MIYVQLFSIYSRYSKLKSGGIFLYRSIVIWYAREFLELIVFTQYDCVMQTAFLVLTSETFFFTLYTNSLMRHVTNCSFFDSLGPLCLYSIMFFTVIVISTCLGLRRSALIKVCLILYINNIPIMNWSLLVTVTYVLLGSQRLWLIENMIISFSPQPMINVYCVSIRTVPS